MNKKIEEIILKNPEHTLFKDSILEFYESIKCVITDDSILTKLFTPERIFCFSIEWLDKNGNTQINDGYRVQFNNALGPYKGGLRFDQKVDLDTLKFLAFEQTMKNSLTGRALGGAKGGSDFDPKGKTDAEILNFCKSFITSFQNVFGDKLDIPAGDIGVGAKEIGFMFGHYKKLTNNHLGILTGKSPDIDGVLGRTEATGYGLIYIVESLLKEKNATLKNKRIVISGTGNVAIHAAYKAIEKGAVVIAMSDRSGYVYDENGLDISSVEKHKLKNPNLENYKKSAFINNKSIWSIACDIALPCATQNEVDKDDIELLIKNDCKIIAEGANKPLTTEAVKIIQESNVDFLPSKAANAGGVAVSSLEMSQNAQMTKFTNEYVDMELQRIMSDIFENISNTAKKYGQDKNYLLGANIYSFIRLEKAIRSQGFI